MGTIKSVTSENLTDYVQERRDLGRPVASPAEAAAAEVTAAAAKQAEDKDSVIVGTGEETTVDGPKPPTAAEMHQEKKPEKDEDGFSKRIKELIEQRKDLEQFASEEYQAKVALAERVKALEAQIQQVTPKKEEKPEDIRPDRSTYDDQDKYENDLLAWNRREALREFETKATEQRQKEAQERLVAEIEERRLSALKSARDAFEDFDDVMKEAAADVRMKRIPAPPQHIERFLAFSPMAGHVLYHFAKNPDEAKKIFALRPEAAALALGEIQSQYRSKAEVEPALKDAEETEAEPVVRKPVTPKSKAPEPMPAIANGRGEVTVDLSKTNDFKLYQRVRTDQIRRKRQGN